LRDEPLDQIDGFLVARDIQNRCKGKFYVLIAGVYNCLNSASEEEGEKSFKENLIRERKKRELLSKLFLSLDLQGEVLISSEVWKDKRYWELVRQVATNLNSEEISKQTGRKGIKLSQFPYKVFENADAIYEDVKDWDSCSFYVPTEVAEAIWLKERYNVSLKIGPLDTEKIYDEVIVKYGLGIIGMIQPSYRARARPEKESYIPPRIKDCVPYIGRKEQNRILFSDNLGEVLRKEDGNPSFQRALELAAYFQRLNYSNDGQPKSRQIYELIQLAGKIR